MKYKKGQGLSINFIVIAAIAALVLVLVIAFTVGGLGGFFRKMTGATQTAEKGTDISTARASCQNLCSQMQQMTGPSGWASGAYCTNREWIDLNRDGVQTSDELVHCWENPIGVTCFKDFGQNTYCDSGNCGTGCKIAACVSRAPIGNETYNCSEDCLGKNYYGCTAPDCVVDCTWTNDYEGTTANE